MDAHSTCPPALGADERRVLTDRIATALAPVRRLATIAHPYADGDAIGSQLALANFVRSRGGQAVTLNFDPLPATLTWIEGLDTLADHLPADFAPELMFLCETTAPNRMGERTRFFRTAPMSVHVDHHPGVEGQGLLNLVDPRASSTCELLYDILTKIQDPLPHAVMLPLYVGIMTDTGNFRFSCTTPRAHEIAARMIERGLEVAPIFRRVYETNRHQRVRLHGRVMQRAECKFAGQVITSYLTLADFAELAANETDADGAINQLGTIEGAEVSVLFRELPDGKIKASFRSLGRVDVQQLCRVFGGGGHTMAAAATVAGPLANAEKLLLSALDGALPSRSA